MMKPLTFVLFLLFAIAHAVFAQYKTVTDFNTFKKSFATATAGTNSIESDFIQTKVLSVLSEKLTSKGKFYFKKDNLVRMEYTSPYKYLMIINGKKVWIKEGQKTTTLSSKSNKMFQQINQLMMDCIRGNVFDNKNFTVRLFEDNHSYLAEMTPITAQMMTLFKKVNVIMKKNTFVVTQVQLFEPSGDYTSLQYVNQKLNTVLPDDLFTIQ